MELEIWSKVLWPLQSSTPSRQRSLQTRTINEVENLQYFSYITIRIRYYKKRQVNDNKLVQEQKFEAGKDK